MARRKGSDLGRGGKRFWLVLGRIGEDSLEPQELSNPQPPGKEERAGAAEKNQQALGQATSNLLRVSRLAAHCRPITKAARASVVPNSHYRVFGSASQCMRLLRSHRTRLYRPADDSKRSATVVYIWETSTAAPLPWTALPMSKTASTSSLQPLSHHRVACSSPPLA